MSRNPLVRLAILRRCRAVWSRRRRLLEALVYQLSRSVIVIANGFSRGPGSDQQAWMELAQIALMKCFLTTAAHGYY